MGGNYMVGPGDNSCMHGDLCWGTGKTVLNIPYPVLFHRKGEGTREISGVVSPADYGLWSPEIGQMHDLQGGLGSREL